VGRVVFEFMRSDEANHILGLRVNVWTSALVFLLGVAIVWLSRRRAAAIPEAGREPAAPSASQNTE
jgi:prolipoprotein diacylglyceryltransferase